MLHDAPLLQAPGCSNVCAGSLAQTSERHAKAVDHPYSKMGSQQPNKGSAAVGKAGFEVRVRLQAAEHAALRDSELLLQIHYKSEIGNPISWNL